MKSAAALALLALALLAPSTTAQVPQGITVADSTHGTPIPYEGSVTVPIGVVVGCVSMLESQSTSVEVSAPTVPAWLTVTPGSAELDPTQCLANAGYTTAAVDVTFAVAKDAPAIVEHTVGLVGTMGSTTSQPGSFSFTVAYNWNYTLVTDATFPMEVHGEPVSFNVTVTQASNARSMVMMEELQVSAGTLSGPASQVYDNEAGQPATKTFLFTYRPPSTEWSNATATFTAYGHYLLVDGRAGEFDEGTVMTFTFTNAGDHHDEGGDGNDAPAPAGVLLALGLVALAGLVRRRA